MPSHVLSRTLFEIACHPVGQRVLKASRVVPACNLVLRAVPNRLRLAGSGVVYRRPFVDSFLLAQEVFSGEEYGCPEFREAAPRLSNIVDLGCNVGYFPLFLEHLRRLGGAKPSSLEGLAVDCNRRALEFARENLSINGLTGVECLWGLAGGSRTGARAVALAASSISSSAEPQRWPSSRIGVAIEDVDYLDLGALWSERFGEARVDLAKIDIEGSEIDFLRGNPEFMERVDRVLLEWHKPQVSQGDVAEALAASGEWLIRPLHEDARFGVLWGQRR